MRLVRLSKLAGLLSKESANVPCIPGLAEQGGAHPLPPSNPSGTQGRLQRLAAPRAKLRKIEAARAYGPRIGKPTV